MGKLTEQSESSFEQEVLKSDVPVLVDFYAPWCGPCKMVAPLLEQLAGEFDGRVKFAKRNVDEAGNLANVYAITGVPTLAIFRNGQLAEKMVGFKGTNALKSLLEAAAAESVKA
jgi:thioredoxin 1